MASAPDMPTALAGKSKKSKKNRSTSNPSDAMMTNNAAGGAVGGAPTQGQPPPTRQLDFNQAMMDFKTMFPLMDREVIETVLRANNGAVDATIDQLLTLAADIPNTPQKPQEPLPPQYGDAMNPGFSSPPQAMAPVTQVTSGNSMRNMSIGDQPPPYSPPSPNSPFSQEMRHRQLPQTPVQRGMLPSPQPQSSPFTPSAVNQALTPSSMNPSARHEPRQLTPSSMSRAATTTGPARPRHPRWNPPLIGDLPADFLRVGREATPHRSSATTQQRAMVSAELQERMERNVKQRKSIDVNDVEMQRMLEDERFALTLQNEEFMRELQRNPEFVAALDRDYSQATGDATVPPAAPVPAANPSTQTNIYPSYQSATPSPAQVMEVGGAAEATAGISNDDVEFRNKLTHMGKTTRYKFAQMAKKFNYKKKRSSKAQLDGVPATSAMNLLDDYDESGDLALLGTRPEVQENLYSDTQKQKSSKKNRRELEEPIIFYQEDNEFALHSEA